MVYCTSLHFLRHEQCCKDGMGFRKHHVYFDEAGTSTPHQKTHFKSELTDHYGPGAPKVGDEAFRQQTKHVVFISFYTLLILLKHRLVTV